MSEKQLSALEKFTIVQGIESGEIGLKAAVKKFGFSKTTIVKWRHLYRLYGIEGLENVPTVVVIRQNLNDRPSRII